MKTVCKKLLSLMLVAVLLVSAVPFQASAAEVTADPTETTAATTTAPAEPAAQASVEDETTAPQTTAPETTAATEAPATESPATEAPETEPAATTGTVTENVTQKPAVNSLGDTGVTVQYVVEVNGDVALVKEYVNQKAGAKFPAPPSAAAVLQTYGQYAGSSQGKKFQQWVDENGTYFDYTKHYIEAENTTGDTVMVFAKVIDAAQRITLNANGGKVSSSSYYVTIGEPYGALPEPTRAHYTFQYWYQTINGVEVPVNGETIVENTSSLTAKWALNTYTVTYQAFPAGGTSEADWTDTGLGAVVNANSTVSVANGTFPTDAQIETYFALPGYTIVGWEIGNTDTAFKAGSTKITDNMIVRPRYQRSVTLKAVNPNTYKSWSTKTIKVEIGEPFGAIVKTLPNPGARDGYTFHAWVVAGTEIEVADLSNPSSHPLYYDGMGYTFEAKFVEAQFVYLHIHTNGNTKTAAKIVPYYLAPAGGIFDMTQINMYSIFPSYGDYDDTVDYAHGWFNDEQWERYCTGKSADNAMYYEELQEQVEANGNNLYIMLYNGGTSSSNNSNANANGYNNNSSTADSSNPTTGDQIFLAVSVMAVSAGALALFFFLKKRKAS